LAPSDMKTVFRSRDHTEITPEVHPAATLALAIPTLAH
jgi:hypothetical protein